MDLMFSRNPDYRAFKRLGLSMLRQVSYWLGADHLLIVEQIGYQERYRRIFYADIQMLAVLQTKRRRNFGFLFGIPGAYLLFLLTGELWKNSSRNGDHSTTIVAGFGFLFFAVLYAINWWKGPGCVCRVYTAVQSFDLPRFNRWKQAQRLLDEIHPLITMAQGVLVPEDLSSSVRFEPGPKINRPVDDALKYEPADAPLTVLRRTKGRAHEIMFWLALVRGPLVLVSVLARADWLYSVGRVLLFVTGILAMVALGQQKGTNLPKRLRLLPIFALIIWVVFPVVGDALRIGQLASTSTRSFFDLLLEFDPVSLAISGVSSLLWLLIGILGLIWLREYRLPVVMPEVPSPASAPESENPVDAPPSVS